MDALRAADGALMTTDALAGRVIERRRVSMLPTLLCARQSASKFWRSSARSGSNRLSSKSGSGAEYGGNRELRSVNPLSSFQFLKSIFAGFAQRCWRCIPQDIFQQHRRVLVSYVAKSFCSVAPNI